VSFGTSTMPIEVIGAGWGRTGTSSFKEAMQILGLPTYHMSDVIENGQAAFWEDACDGKGCDSKGLKQGLAFEKVFFDGTEREYRATCDFPSAIFWKEQLVKYPDAKVVLTTRDSESWHKSCCDTIFMMTGSSPYSPLGVRIATRCGLPTRRFYEMTEKVVSMGAVGGNWEKEQVKKAFNDYNDGVIRECPKGRLLVFQAKDGWEPLCQFLGKPIPDQPYPHANDTAHFKKIVMLVNTVGYVILATPFVLSAGAAWWSGAFAGQGADL